MHRAGIVGLGAVGEWHLRKYAEADAIEPVAIADVDADRVAELGTEYDIPESHHYTDHQSLLQSESLDAVSIASPTTFHYEHVIDAVEYGTQDVIFCEKPIATAVSDGDEMTEACDEAGIELVVNHSRRFGPEFQSLVHHIRERRTLGELRSIHVDWPQELMRNGIHAVDLLYSLVDPVIAVSGHLTNRSGVNPPIETDDVAGGGYLVTESDTFVTLNATVSRAARITDLSIIGTEGRLGIDMQSGDIDYKRRDGNEWSPATLDGLTQWSSDSEVYFDGAIENIVALIEDENARNRSPGSAATAVLELLVGLYVSGYTGTTVEMPLPSSFRDVTIESW